MIQERLMKVLLEPHVSEKSTNVATHGNQIVFKVCPMQPSRKSSKRSKKCLK